MSTASYALCTLDDVKDFYGMSGSVAEDDDLLEDLIDNISKLFNTYCGVTSFKRATYTQYYDGDDAKNLFLKEQPVISITSIYVDSNWGWTSSYLLDSDDYRIVDIKYVFYKSSFTKGDQNVKIVYQAGYAETPGDLKLVCIMEVLRKYKHRKDFDVLNKTLGDGTAQYVDLALLLGTTLVLNKYKSGYVA
jgi:hypothetical protein